MRQQIEDLEGRLVAELEMGLHQKAALQRVDLAVQQVKHENELLQQQLDESTLAEVRCTQFTCFITRRPVELEHAMASATGVEERQKALIDELRKQLAAARTYSLYLLY